VLPYWIAQFAGAICVALFLQLMFTHVTAGGNYPIAKPGGDWRSLVMEIVLTAILASVILNTATGAAVSATTRLSRWVPRWRCWACSPARSAARR
jgi:glycerol uptake facilitator-like aquaporin